MHFNCCIIFHCIKVTQNTHSFFSWWNFVIYSFWPMGAMFLPWLLCLYPWVYVRGVLQGKLRGVGLPDHSCISFPLSQKIHTTPYQTGWSNLHTYQQCVKCYLLSSSALKSKQTNISLSSWNSQSHLISTTTLKERSSLPGTQESTRGSRRRGLIPGADAGGGARQ